MIVFFTIFFTVYSAINFYIFIRGWQALEGFPAVRIFYLIFFIIFAFSYIAAKFLHKKLPGPLYDAMIWIGSFWFALMIYFLIAILFIDLLRAVNGFFHFIPDFVRADYQTSKRILLLIVLVMVFLTVASGFHNRKNIVIKRIDIEIAKRSAKSGSLNAVMIADIHLSPINNEKFLAGIVEIVNKLSPDIVFIPGDVLDENAEVLRERNIGRSLKNIKSRYGVFASTGNHEFINKIEPCVEYLKENNIKVLGDEAVLIDNQFYVAGRDDSSKRTFTGKERKPLNEILSNIDKNYPVILLDHTPFHLEEAEKNNIDLQLSGHTHNGQFFPNNIITKMIYELSWGYLKKGNTQYYVTSGVGTWGPPVKIASKSEIVDLRIKFTG